MIYISREGGLYSVVFISREGGLYRVDYISREGGLYRVVYISRKGGLYRVVYISREGGLYRVVYISREGGLYRVVYISREGGRVGSGECSSLPDEMYFFYRGGRDVVICTSMRIADLGGKYRGIDVMTGLVSGLSRSIGVLA